MQNKEVTTLFKKIEKTESEEEKVALFEELAANLAAHDAIEREIFYPAIEKKMGMDDMLGEALVEHGVVEFSLYQASQAMGGEDFDFKCAVLKEMVEHHVEEEEKEMFKKVEKEFSADELETLGEKMEARFEKALEKD